MEPGQARGPWWRPHLSARWWITRGWAWALALAYAGIGTTFIAEPPGVDDTIGTHGASFVLAASLLFWVGYAPESERVRASAAAVCAFATGVRAIALFLSSEYASGSKLLGVIVWSMLTCLVPFVAAVTGQYATRGRRS